MADSSSPACRLDIRSRTISPAIAKLSACAELVRLRIAVLVLLATATGFVLALPDGHGSFAWTILLHTLVGTGLVAASANTLNQVIEADRDGLMIRTMSRPIPTGRLSRMSAGLIGLTLGVVGIVDLTVFVGALTGLIGMLTLTSYVLLYTPLKRFSWRCVFVGAVPGALPPVIGWTAATGTLSTSAASLFLIVFVWQLPHFAAIAWLHRDDYKRAGYPVLAAADSTGNRLARHMLSYSWLLVGVSILPVWFGIAGPVYAGGAIALGLGFVSIGMFFSRQRTAAAARVHLLSSVVYLPLLLGLMVLDKG